MCRINPETDRNPCRGISRFSLSIHFCSIKKLNLRIPNMGQIYAIFTHLQVLLKTFLYLLMKFDLSHLVLAGAVALLGWLLFTDGCCGDSEQGGGDTSSHVAVIPADSLTPDTVHIPTFHEIIRTVFRHDTAAVNRLLAAHDSALAVLDAGFNARAAAIVDSLRLHICDSLALTRHYLETAGDSNVTVTVFARTLGVLDSLSIGWQHHRDPVLIPARKRMLLAGVTAGSDTLLAPGLMFIDRKGRSFNVGYEVLKGGVTVGVHWPVWGR